MAPGVLALASCHPSLIKLQGENLVPTECGTENSAQLQPDGLDVPGMVRGNSMRLAGVPHEWRFSKGKTTFKWRDFLLPWLITEG